MEKQSLSKLKRKRITKLYSWKIISLILLVLLILSLYYNGFAFNFGKLSEEEAKIRAELFLKKSIDPKLGITANVDEVKELKNIYELKISVKVNDFTQRTVAYMTKDGELFFPEAIGANELPLQETTNELDIAQNSNTT